MINNRVYGLRLGDKQLSNMSLINLATGNRVNLHTQFFFVLNVKLNDDDEEENGGGGLLKTKKTEY